MSGRSPPPCRCPRSLIARRPAGMPRRSGLCCGCFAALYVVAVRPVTDNDVWWHLATGRYILATGTIPSHDVFSYSARSHTWITHEWLTEVVLYWLQSHGGYGPMMLSWAAVITAAFAVVYRLARASGSSRWIALPVTLLAAAASSHTWGVRPQMLSLLLFAVYAALLWWPDGYACALDMRLSRGRQVTLVLLTLFWVNLHGGYIFGLLLIGLELFAALVAALIGSLPRRGASVQRARTLALTLVACLAVGLLNPNTWRVLIYPFSYLGNNASVRYIAEWVSPNFHQGNYLFFEALIFALLVGLALSPRRPSPRMLLITLVFAYLGLRIGAQYPALLRGGYAGDRGGSSGNLADYGLGAHSTLTTCRAFGARPDELGHCGRHSGRHIGLGFPANQRQGCAPRRSRGLPHACRGVHAQPRGAPAAV